jgi:transposase-like protein
MLSILKEIVLTNIIENNGQFKTHEINTICDNYTRKNITNEINNDLILSLKEIIHEVMFMMDRRPQYYLPLRFTNAKAISYYIYKYNDIKKNTHIKCIKR